MTSLTQCNATGCKSREKYSGDDIVSTGTLDCRFPPQLCNRFDREEREFWRKECQHRHEQRKALSHAASKLRIANATKNLRQRSRSSAEQWEAQRRHGDKLNL